MAEVLYADGTVSGTVSTPANAHGANDGTYTTDTGDTTWTHRWSLDNPVGSAQANQTVAIDVYVRRSAATSNPSVTSIALLDNGTQLAIDSTGWSLSGAQTITVNLAVTGIANDGDNLQVEIVTASATGKPSDRTCVQVDAIEATVQIASTDRAAQLSWAELEVGDAPRAAQLSWAEMEVPDFPLVQVASGTGAGGAQVTITYGSATTSGNLLLAGVFSRDNLKPSLPSGWTEEIAVEDTTNGDWFCMYSKVSDGTETSVVLGASTGSSVDRNAGWIAEYSGFSGTPTVEAAPTAGASYAVNSLGVSSGTVTNTPALMVASHTARDWADATGNAISYDSLFAERADEGGGDDGASWTHIGMADAENSDGTSDTATMTPNETAMDMMAGMLVIYDLAATTDRTAQLSWAELETPDAARAARISWTELELPDAARAAQLSWAELEIGDAARAARLVWTELELPTAPRRARVSWAEYEIPTAPRTALLSWAELEIPDGARAAQVVWTELEIPTAPRRAQLTWAEVEVPTAPRRARLSWAELEMGDAPRRAQVSWAEMEVADAPRAAQIVWTELEVPTAPRRVRLSWTEMEVGDAPRAARLSWAELEAPEITRAAQLVWAEMEVPDAPRGVRLTWAEVETPEAARAARIVWTEMELPDGARAGRLTWAEMEVPDGARAARLGWAELEVPTAPRGARLAWTEYEVPDTPGRSVLLVWTEMQVPDAVGPERANRMSLMGHR